MKAVTHALSLFFLSLITTVGGAQELEGLQLDKNPGKSAIVEITEGRMIKGELLDFDSISVKTSFGEPTFNVQEIDGIKFDIDGKKSCVFAFVNGDLVTGKLQMKSVRVKTDWGDANIQVDKIVSIRINEQGEFYSDQSSDGVPRWRFGIARPVNNNASQVAPQGMRILQQQRNINPGVRQNRN